MITCQDASSIYKVPLILEKEGLAQQTLQLLKLEEREPDLTEWNTLIEKMESPKTTLNIAIVGKYIQLSGTSPDGRLVEMIELPEHPFFIASQFHPEFLSRPSRPHPLFLGLVQAAFKRISVKL